MTKKSLNNDQIIDKMINDQIIFYQLFDQGQKRSILNAPCIQPYPYNLTSLHMAVKSLKALIPYDI